MKRIKGKEIFLIISLFLIIAYALIYYLFPSFQADLESINASLESFARSHGYWGAFIVSLVGSASLFIVISYPAFVFILAAAGLNIWFLSLIAGLGAGLGEITSYFVGYAGGRLSEKHHGERFSRLNQWICRHPRLTPLVIFIFGLTPLPDDLIFIPLGLVKYRFKKAFIPGFLGEMIMLLALTYFGQRSLDWLGLEGTGIWGQIVTILLTVLIIYGVLKIDWARLIEKENV